MDKYKEAFTYLFKEKNWGWKFLLPFIAQMVLIVTAVLMSIPEALQKNSTTYYKGTYSSYSTSLGALYWILMCIYYIVVIIVAVINMYYLYENAQAAIEKRETKGFWQYSGSVITKRIGKLFLVNFIYGLIPATIITAFLMIMIFGGVFAGVGLYSSSSYSSANSSGTILLFLCLLCVGIIIYTVFAFIWEYFITLPAKLRLIETNTFGKSFDFGKNYNIAKKNAGEILKLILLNILIVFVASMIFIISIFVAIIPILGWIVFILVAIVFFVFMLYYQQFVVPYMMGILWRTIKK